MEEKNAWAADMLASFLQLLKPLLHPKEHVVLAVQPLPSVQVSKLLPLQRFVPGLQARHWPFEQPVEQV
jgi:hypothetical protein